MTMLRFFALLTGDRHELLQKHGPASRRKVVAMGSGLLLVTGLWIFTGFNMGSNVFGMDAAPAIGLGLGCGAVVFLVDRMLLLGVGVHWSTAATRTALAVLMSIIGSMGLDLYIMRAEIGQTLVEVHREAHAGMMEAITQRHATEQAAAEQAIAQARTELAAAERDWRNEMDGTAGSGRYGVGAVARAKGHIVQDRRKALADARQHAQQIQDRKAAEQAAKADELARAQASGGLFERVHAMHRYMVSDPLVLIAYVFLTLILVLVELSPLLMKLGLPKTAYERGIEVADQKQRERLDALATMQQRIYAQAAAMSVEEQRARARMKAISDSYYGLN
jgi:hypothetical protein